MVILYTVSSSLPFDAVLRLDDSSELISSLASEQNNRISTHQLNIKVSANLDPVEIRQAINQGWLCCLHLSDHLALLGFNPLCI